MKKLIIVVFLFLASLIVSTYFIGKSDTYKVQKEIAEEIIRFHVRANSDSDEDQALKIKVKDAIVLYLQEELASATYLDEARNILYDDRDEIKNIALDIIETEGYDYQVEVYFEESYFPMKVYGDLSFPPGTYEAFRVDIGDACGKNWWCVLYPPLCFVDSTYSVVPEDTKAQFKEVLSEEAYLAISTEDESDYTYEFKFKFLSFLNKE